MFWIFLRSSILKIVFPINYFFKKKNQQRTNVHRLFSCNYSYQYKNQNRWLIVFPHSDRRSLVVHVPLILRRRFLHVRFVWLLYRFGIPVLNHHRFYYGFLGERKYTRFYFYSSLYYLLIRFSVGVPTYTRNPLKGKTHVVPLPTRVDSRL